MHTRIHRQPVANYVASSEHRAHTREAAKKKSDEQKKCCYGILAHPNAIDEKTNEQANKSVSLQPAKRRNRSLDCRQFCGNSSHKASNYSKYFNFFLAAATAHACDVAQTRARAVI